MGKKKYYAIRNYSEEGMITSDYTVFDNIMRQSKGKNLIGKGFATEEEAAKFLSLKTYYAYTDCSYDYSTQKCSYGYKIFDNGNELICSYSAIQIDTTGLANVYGELMAVMKAVEIGIQSGQKLEIYFDFIGIKTLLSIAKKKPNRKYAPFIVSYITYMNENHDYYILKNVNRYKSKRSIHN